MSRLPLSERLAKPMKQPKELEAWSEVDGRIFTDDRALRYYYFPTTELNRGLKLDVGASTYRASPPEEKYIDPVLAAVERWERANGRLDVSLITWRGLITKIIMASQKADAFSDEVLLDVVGFDGQVFISSNHTQDVNNFSKGWFRDRDRFMYAGYNFERFATLHRPWPECSRDEVEQRYRGAWQPGSEYGILVRGGVGPIKVAYGAEVDCTESFKDPADPTAHYVEMKTSAEIRDSKSASKFERKLMRTWLQSFLVGVPKVVYGFRNSKFELVAVEEFATTKIPSLIKNSRVLAPHDRWNGNDAIAFYAVFLSWIKETVKDGHTYQLRWTPQSPYLELLETPRPISVPGREVAFLSNEFVAWRRSQKSGPTAEEGK